MRNDIKPCKTCQKLTKLLVAEAGYTKGWFCDQNCYNKYVRSKELEREPRFEYTCGCCGKVFKLKRKQPTSISGFYFCSRECSNKETSKIRAASRKFDRYGYVTVYDPYHPQAKKNNPRVYEHRLVVEKSIGRFLQEEEVVHHINYLPEDNRLENLFLCENQSEHAFLHRLTRWLIYEFIREKGFAIELTSYIRKRFVDSYKQGSYKELNRGNQYELFSKIFGANPTRDGVENDLFESTSTTKPEIEE